MSDLVEFKVLSQAKRVGEIKISYLAREIGHSKSFIHKLLNEKLGKFFDKLHFSYNNVIYVLKSLRSRFSHLYKKGTVTIETDEEFGNGLLRLATNSRMRRSIRDGIT